jgi:Pyruvate/2-oxoacid:ferredoxin oxidoreductase gamma subunit
MLLKAAVAAAIAARSGFSGPAAPEYDVAVRMGVADAFCRKRRSEKEGERKKTRVT